MNSSASSSILQSNRLQAISLLFLAFYLLGTFFPDTWWTTHFLAFMTPEWRTSLLVISGGLVVASCLNPKGIQVSAGWQSLSDRFGLWIILLLVGLAGWMMIHFPIVQDSYGDAYKLLGTVQQQVSSIPEGTREALFSFDLSPWAGHSSTLALVTYIAYFAEISYGEAFLWLDVACGCLFVFTWLSAVRWYLDRLSSRLVMGLAGITAPFLLIFFGHIESYAPVCLFFLVWMVGALVYIQKKQVRILWSLIPLLMICMKFHPIAGLFIPAVGLLFLHHYGHSSSWSFRALNWQGISRWILAPVFAAGAFLYFFVFGDYNDSRSLHETAMEFDRLFLPLLSPEAPLDRYNLLSFNHIFDYFCELFLWSPIALFVLVAILFAGKKRIQWNTLPILITGLSLILLAALLFVINPLLSMQMDWDLLAIPAPVFLMFVLVLVKQVEHSSFGGQLLPTSLALSLLSLPVFLIHAEVDAHSHRLERLGVRMYHTYYEWSGKVIQRALDMPTYDSRQAYEVRKSRILNELKPHAIRGIDFEYALLLLGEGKYHLRQSREYEKAFGFLKEAESFFPKEKNVSLYLMEANFLTRQNQEAFAYSMDLVRMQYPSEKKSIAIATQCALEAGIYGEALDLSQYYVQNWDDHQAIREVARRLESEENVEGLRELFVR